MIITTFKKCLELLITLRKELKTKREKILDNYKKENIPFRITHYKSVDQL